MERVDSMMMQRILLLMLLGTLHMACAAEPLSLQAVSQKYRQTKDYMSLEVIYKSLHSGMKRREVELLLGEPDYSPTEGQYYYSSDRVETGQGVMRTRVLVLDYRRGEVGAAEVLEGFWLGSIGE